MPLLDYKVMGNYCHEFINVKLQSRYEEVLKVYSTSLYQGIVLSLRLNIPAPVASSNKKKNSHKSDFSPSLKVVVAKFTGGSRVHLQLKLALDFTHRVRLREWISEDYTGKMISEQRKQSFGKMLLPLIMNHCNNWTETDAWNLRYLLLSNVIRVCVPLEMNNVAAPRGKILDLEQWSGSGSVSHKQDNREQLIDVDMYLRTEDPLVFISWWLILFPQRVTCDRLKAPFSLQ